MYLEYGMNHSFNNIETTQLLHEKPGLVSEIGVNKVRGTGNRFQPPCSRDFLFGYLSRMPVVPGTCAVALVRIQWRTKVSAMLLSRRAASEEAPAGRAVGR